MGCTEECEGRNCTHAGLNRRNGIKYRSYHVGTSRDKFRALRGMAVVCSYSNLTFSRWSERNYTVNVIPMSRFHPRRSPLELGNLPRVTCKIHGVSPPVNQWILHRLE